MKFRKKRGNRWRTITRDDTANTLHAEHSREAGDKRKAYTKRDKRRFARKSPKSHVGSLMKDVSGKKPALIIEWPIKRERLIKDRHKN